MFKTINGGQLPQRATKYSAGFDVFANEDVVIGAGETKLISLGIAIDVEFTESFMSTYYFELHPRSSLRAKGLGGGVGIIDIDFRDEIKIVINNPITEIIDFQDGSTDTLGVNKDTTIGYEIKRGDKIGQLILKSHHGILMPSEYTKDEDRNGGFGSTS